MKITKKCNHTQNIKESIINKLSRLDQKRHKRRSSAGMFYTSSAGAVTSLILMLALPLILGLTGANQAFATTSTLTISVTDSVSLSILPTSTSGIFATSGTSANNISVSTNNGTGYTLGIKASTEGSNALINEDDNTKTIPSHSVAAGISESNYNDDSYASTNNLNNTWGYRPSIYWDTTNNIVIDNTSTNLYFPGPTSTSTPTILDKTSASNPSTVNNYNIAIGARVNSSTASGTYSNTFIITVTANPAIYSITYNANATSVSNMPSNVVNQETSGETVTLASNTPTRTDYTFEGWCTAQVADGADCTGTSYAAGSNWTIDQTAASNSLTLYARWKLNKIYIQDLTLSQCQKNVGMDGNPAGIGDNITVYDKRDENDYAVRYINGLCWMTQNLRFQGSSINSMDTNINIAKTLTWYNLAGTEGSSSSGHCYGDATFDSNWNLIWVGNGWNYLCKQDSGDVIIGVWYNYAGATAGTITGTNNSTKASYDICPKNWHIPSGPSTTVDTEYNKLVGNTISGYQDSTAGLAAFGAVVGGYYYNGSLNGTNSGYWWSSAMYNAENRYRLAYYSSDDQFKGDYYYDPRYLGVHIRCVRSS